MVNSMHEALKRKMMEMKASAAKGGVDLDPDHDGDIDIDPAKEGSELAPKMAGHGSDPASAVVKKPSMPEVGGSMMGAGEPHEQMGSQEQKMLAAVADARGTTGSLSQRAAGLAKEKLASMQKEKMKR